MSCDFGEVLVDIKIRGSKPPAAEDLSRQCAPDAMPEVFSCQRRVDGTHDGMSSSDAADNRQILADCYEWMWALCFTAHDPLMVESQRGLRESYRSSGDLLNMQDASSSPASSVPPPPTSQSLPEGNGGNESGANTARSYSGSSLPPFAPGHYTSPVSTFQKSFSEERNLPVGIDLLTPPSGEVRKRLSIHETKESPVPGVSNNSNNINIAIERSLSADDLHQMITHSLAPSKPVRRGSKHVPALKMQSEDSDDENDDDDGGVNNGRAGQQEAEESSEVSLSVASLLLGDATSPSLSTGQSSVHHASQSSKSGPLGTVFQSMQNLSEGILDDEVSVPPATTDLASSASADAVEPGNAVSSTVSSPTSNTPASAGVSPNSSKREALKRRGSCKVSVKPRVDFPYSIEWIDAHVQQLQEMVNEIENLMGGLRHKVRSDRCFRASVYKKDAEWQMLPTNFHYQMLGVQYHHMKGSNVGGSEKMANIMHSITCGAMTPHMLKHKKGGLALQEAQLEGKKIELNSLKDRFLAQVAESGHTQIPIKSGGAYKTLRLIGGKVESFESHCLEIGRRRMFALSQSVSIAANAFLLKLHLVCTGAVEGIIAEKWLSDGFLLVFEGLLSVTGHEKSMLEDTISAVDNLRYFRLRLLSKAATDSFHGRRGSVNALGESSVASVAAAPADETDLTPEPDFVFKGREIIIYLPKVAIDALPSEYQKRIYKSGGALVSLVPVLFTQVSCSVRAILYLWY